MRVDDLDAPSGEGSLAASAFTVPAAPLPTLADGADPGLQAVSSEFPSLLNDDSAPHPTRVGTHAPSTAVLGKATLGAIPVSLWPTSADGSDPSLQTISSEFAPSLRDDRAPHPTPVATPASSTLVLDKVVLVAILPALPVHKDSVVRQKHSGPQTPSVVSHSA